MTSRSLCGCYTTPFERHSSTACGTSSCNAVDRTRSAKMPAHQLACTHFACRPGRTLIRALVCAPDDCIGRAKPLRLPSCNSSRARAPTHRSATRIWTASLFEETLVPAGPVRRRTSRAARTELAPGVSLSKIDIILFLPFSPTKCAYPEHRSTCDRTFHGKSRLSPDFQSRYK